MVKNHRVVSDDGDGRQEFEVEFDAQWRFWKVSGYCAIPLRMYLDMRNGEVWGLPAAQMLQAERF